MKTELLYLKNAYAKEMTANVLDIIDERFLVLDKTVFYPSGGGQPHDTGMVTKDTIKANIINVIKKDNLILHELDVPSPFNIGDIVLGELDWNRRYTLMRYHTSAHILSELLERESETLISGNQLYEHKARLDFTLEHFDRKFMLSFEGKVNEIVVQALPIKKYIISKTEALKDESLFTLLKGFPEHIQDVRIVEIQGFDKTACGGTHLDNTKEIGGIKITALENKGSKRRRIVFTLHD